MEETSGRQNHTVVDKVIDMDLHFGRALAVHCYTYYGTKDMGQNYNNLLQDYQYT
jgi:hypothetical protein